MINKSNVCSRSKVLENKFCFVQIVKITIRKQSRNTTGPSFVGIHICRNFYALGSSSVKNFNYLSCLTPKKFRAQFPVINIYWYLCLLSNFYYLIHSLPIVSILTSYMTLILAPIICRHFCQGYYLFC